MAERVPRVIMMLCS